tara:strand:+ start:2294 stop:2926 length:633 start_codon:yes stop_codon:yes gene_type:complete
MNFPVSINRAVLNPFSRIASPKKVLGLITAGMTLLTMARAIVCLVEAYSAVRSERMADYGLIVLCEERSEAAISADFRTLCLRKRAERAAPILLKAILRAVTTAFSEFCEVFSSPSRVALLVLFSITGMAAPVVRALAAMFMHNIKKRRMKQSAKYTTSDSEASEDEDGHFQVVKISPRHEYNTRQNLGLTLRRQFQRASGIVTPPITLI